MWFSYHSDGEHIEENGPKVLSTLIVASLRLKVFSRNGAKSLKIRVEVRNLSKRGTGFLS
jgi:hypothetical protein